MGQEQSKATPLPSRGDFDYFFQKDINDRPDPFSHLDKPGPHYSDDYYNSLIPVLPAKVTYFIPVFGRPEHVSGFTQVASCWNSDDPLFGSFILTPMSLNISQTLPNPKLLRRFQREDRSCDGVGVTRDYYCSAREISLVLQCPETLSNYPFTAKNPNPFSSPLNFLKLSLSDPEILPDGAVKVYSHRLRNLDLGWGLYTREKQVQEAFDIFPLYGFTQRYPPLRSKRPQHQFLPEPMLINVVPTTGYNFNQFVGYNHFDDPTLYHHSTVLIVDPSSESSRVALADLIIQTSTLLSKGCIYSLVDVEVYVFILTVTALDEAVLDQNEIRMALSGCGFSEDSIHFQNFTLSKNWSLSQTTVQYTPDCSIRYYPLRCSTTQFPFEPQQLLLSTNDMIEYTKPIWDSLYQKHYNLWANGAFLPPSTRLNKITLTPPHIQPSVSFPSLLNGEMGLRLPLSLFEIVKTEDALIEYKNMGFCRYVDSDPFTIKQCVLFMALHRYYRGLIEENSKMWSEKEGLEGQTTIQTTSPMITYSQFRQKNNATTANSWIPHRFKHILTPGPYRFPALYLEVQKSTGTFSPIQYQAPFFINTNVKQHVFPFAQPPNPPKLLQRGAIPTKIELESFLLWDDDILLSDHHHHFAGYYYTDPRSPLYEQIMKHYIDQKQPARAFFEVNRPRYIYQQFLSDSDNFNKQMEKFPLSPDSSPSDDIIIDDNIIDDDDDEETKEMKRNKIAQAQNHPPPRRSNYLKNCERFDTEDYNSLQKLALDNIVKRYFGGYPCYLKDDWTPCPKTVDLRHPVIKKLTPYDKLYPQLDQYNHQWRFAMSMETLGIPDRDLQTPCNIVPPVISEAHKASIKTIISPCHSRAVWSHGSIAAAGYNGRRSVWGNDSQPAILNGNHNDDGFAQSENVNNNQNNQNNNQNNQNNNTPNSKEIAQIRMTYTHFGLSVPFSLPGLRSASLNSLYHYYQHPMGKANIPFSPLAFSHGIIVLPFVYQHSHGVEFPPPRPPINPNQSHNNQAINNNDDDDNDNEDEPKRLPRGVMLNIHPAFAVDAAWNARYSPHNPYPIGFIPPRIPALRTTRPSYQAHLPHWDRVVKINDRNDTSTREFCDVLQQHPSMVHLPASRLVSTIPSTSSIPYTLSPQGPNKDDIWDNNNQLIDKDERKKLMMRFNGGNVGPWCRPVDNNHGDCSLHQLPHNVNRLNPPTNHHYNPSFQQDIDSLTPSLMGLYPDIPAGDISTLHITDKFASVPFLTQMNCPVNFIVLCANPIVNDLVDDGSGIWYPVREIPQEQRSIGRTGRGRDYEGIKEEIEEEMEMEGEENDNNLKEKENDKNNNINNNNNNNNPADDTNSLKNSSTTPTTSPLSPSSTTPTTPTTTINTNTTTTQKLHTIQQDKKEQEEKQQEQFKKKLDPITKSQFRYLKETIPSLYLHQLINIISLPRENFNPTRLESLWNVEFHHSDDLVGVLKRLEYTAIEKRLDLYRDLASMEDEDQ